MVSRFYEFCVFLAKNDIDALHYVCRRGHAGGYPKGRPDTLIPEFLLERGLRRREQTSTSPMVPVGRRRRAGLPVKLQPGICPFLVLGFWGKNTKLYVGTMDIAGISVHCQYLEY